MANRDKGQVDGFETTLRWNFSCQEQSQYYGVMVWRKLNQEMYETLFHKAAHFEDQRIIVRSFPHQFTPFFQAMLSKSVVALEKFQDDAYRLNLQKTCLFVSVLHSAKDSYLKKNHSGIFVQCSATAAGCKKGIKKVKKICTHCFDFAQHKYKPSPVTLFCYFDPAGT